MIPFREFVPKYLDGSIAEDATWRSYDIERMAVRTKAMQALKTLGYPANTFGLDQARCDYGLNHASQSQLMLALWWTWAQLALGEVKRGILRKDGK